MAADWTRSPQGRSNSSETYLLVVRHVERLIRGDAFALINGDANSTARLIVSNLAHLWGMGAPSRNPGDDNSPLTAEGDDPMWRDDPVVP